MKWPWSKKATTVSGSETAKPKLDVDHIICCSTWTSVPSAVTHLMVGSVKHAHDEKQKRALVEIIASRAEPQLSSYVEAFEDEARRSFANWIDGQLYFELKDGQSVIDLPNVRNYCRLFDLTQEQLNELFRQHIEELKALGGWALVYRVMSKLFPTELDQNTTQKCFDQMRDHNELEFALEVASKHDFLRDQARDLVYEQILNLLVIAHNRLPDLVCPKHDTLSLKKNLVDRVEKLLADFNMRDLDTIKALMHLLDDCSVDAYLIFEQLEERLGDRQYDMEYNDLMKCLFSLHCQTILNHPEYFKSLRYRVEVKRVMSKYLKSATAEALMKWYLERGNVVKDPLLVHWYRSQQSK